MAKKILASILAICLVLSTMTVVFADGSAVAKVGNTEYPTIDEAIANWTNGTTLTLLANVQLTNTIELSSTEMHTLDLGIYTMTAASGKNAIQIMPNGRTKAGYALDIKADATNPGGITATGKACIYSQGKSGVQDRPIIRIYSGIFNGTCAIQHSGSNGTKCPQFLIYGGEFNGSISTNRTLNQIFGGTFNKAFTISPDSSAYTRIEGGRFVDLKNNYMSDLNGDKWTFGTEKNKFDVNIYIDDEGYYVVTKSELEDVDIQAEVPVDYDSVSNTSRDATFKYSKLNTDKKLTYTSVDVALANNNSGTIILYEDSSAAGKASGALTIDCSSGAVYNGNVTLSSKSSTFKIILPENGTFEGTVTQYDSTYYLVKDEDIVDGKKVITYTQTNNPEATDSEASLSSNGINTLYSYFNDALVDAVGGDTIKLYKDVTYNIDTTKSITLFANGDPIIIDLNGKTFSPEDPTIPTFINGETYIIKNGTIIGDVVNNGGELIIENVIVEGDVIINSGTADITSGKFTGAIVTADVNALDITGGRYTEDPAAYVPEGYDVIRHADYYEVKDLSKEAKSISVEFDKTDVDENDEDNLEGKDTYNIVLKANEGDEINELASADLTFNLDKSLAINGAMSYTITPAEGMTLTQIGDRYMFNYNGVDKDEDSGASLVIGELVIEGYGEYTFSTVDVDTNIVNATTFYDNLVDYYIPNGDVDTDSATGGLVIDDAINATIAVPTRTLTVNVEFPNIVKDNGADYQNMTVTISGGDLDADIVTALGDGDYTVEEELTLNTAYTVTVKGLGYRTARYTVTMTGAKTLNFWNNVMDNAKVVEVDEDASAVTKNFLAGDIVADNMINIYDLSAAVSYFTESAYDNAEYIKYDLNRDGVIDSKDVAYILVSWGE